MAGVQRLAVGGLTAAAVIEALMPNYAVGQQVSRTDDRIDATYQTVPSPQGNGIIKGYLVRPVSADTRNAMPTKLPGIIVIHENRGLNPHIEDVARRFALLNFMAFAPDGLTSLGGFPGDDFKGGQMFSKVDGKKMQEDFVASAMWLKSRSDCSGKQHQYNLNPRFHKTHTRVFRVTPIHRRRTRHAGPAGTLTRD